MKTIVITTETGQELGDITIPILGLQYLIGTIKVYKDLIKENDLLIYFPKEAKDPKEYVNPIKEILNRKSYTQTYVNGRLVIAL